MSPPAAGRVLRLAVVGWGLGHLAMGRTGAGLALMAAQAILIAIITFLTLVLADTSWYLVPYLLGIAFLAAWAVQAVHAYHAAQHIHGAIPPATSHSPALAIAWLTLPLLLWGTGFWLVAADAATPAAVVDRFVTGWATGVAPEEDATDPLAEVGTDPGTLRAEATAALELLEIRCAAGDLPEDCGEADGNLLRDVRVRITGREAASATAVAELVRYERRPSSFLGLFRTTEIVPVPVARVLTLRLEAQPAFLGARRWVIVNADAGR